MDRRTDARFALKSFNTKSPNNGKCAQTLQLANAQFTPPIRRDATRPNSFVASCGGACECGIDQARRDAARRGARATRGRCTHLSELATSTNRSHTTLYPHYATLRYATLGTCARVLLVVSPAQQCSVSVAPSKSIDFPALYDVD